MVEGELNANRWWCCRLIMMLLTYQVHKVYLLLLEQRGNVEVGFTAAAGLDDFDAILKNLDTQGAIEENMLFLQRQTSLDFDDMLASISGGFAGGTAFGLFENSEEMALKS